MFSFVVDAGFLDKARELLMPLSNQAMLPEVAVFTMVIMAYAGAGKTKDAHKVYRHMLGTAVTPTSYTYTALSPLVMGLSPAPILTQF
ncbi:putative pentatricopeptide [Rosa chinensis]|uniref:Putative pentatricopeptide n=1 Tax=Rosa chinensis TaxID=74649 RepID=A0A2P6PFI4_ROSCH|nr:putative pentatricopeptide [Rosa chinensis]